MSDLIPCSQHRHAVPLYLAETVNHLENMLADARWPRVNHKAKVSETTNVHGKCLGLSMLCGGPVRESVILDLPFKLFAVAASPYR